MKEYLPAIDELIEYYSSFKWWRIPISLGPSCPLCIKAGYLTGDDCGTCPWVTYGGAECYSLHFGDDRTYKRLKRLKRWRKQIERGPATIQIEVGDLIVTVNAENHAGYWEILKARLFGERVETAETTVIKYRGKYYLTDYKGANKL